MTNKKNIDDEKIQKIKDYIINQLLMKEDETLSKFLLSIKNDYIHKGLKRMDKRKLKQLLKYID